MASNPDEAAGAVLAARRRAAGEERSPDRLQPTAEHHDAAGAGRAGVTTRRDELPARPGNGTPGAHDVIAAVHVVEADKAVRESAALLLRSGGVPARTYPSGHALLQALSTSGGNDAVCVLTGLRMPGLNGLKLLGALRDRGFGLPVIVMSGCADVLTVMEAMRAGAATFLEKPFDGDSLFAAVQAALEASCSDAGAEAAARVAMLPPREREVLGLLLAGKPNKAVARELGFGLREVELLRAQLMARLGVDSLAGAAQLAVRAGRAQGGPRGGAGAEPDRRRSGQRPVPLVASAS